MSDVWKGVALPWGPDIPSFIEPKDDEYILKSSLVFILLTRKGERVMLPEFGSAIPDAIFEQNDEVLEATLHTAVEEAIAQWDDRIEFSSFAVERDEDRNTLRVKVEWKNAKDPLEERLQVTEIEVTPSMLGLLV